MTVQPQVTELTQEMPILTAISDPVPGLCKSVDSQKMICPPSYPYPSKFKNFCWCNLLVVQKFSEVREIIPINYFFINIGPKNDEFG